MSPSIYPFFTGLTDRQLHDITVVILMQLNLLYSPMYVRGMTLTNPPREFLLYFIPFYQSSSETNISGVPYRNQLNFLVHIPQRLVSRLLKTAATKYVVLDL